MSGDPYVDPSTGVLRNRLGISDRDELAQAEGDLSALAAYRLARKPIVGAFDLRHLQRIHRALFGAVYDWAGELRTVEIAKQSDMFCPVRMLSPYAPHVFDTIERGSQLAGLSPEQVLVRLPRHLAEINALHPFREGNGRAQRAFLGQWAAEGGVALDWSQLDQERNIAAARASFRGDLQPLRELLSELATPIRSRDHDRGDPGRGR